MKKKFTLTFSFSVIAAVFVLIGTLYFNSNHDYTLTSTKHSPNSKYVLTKFKSMSEAGHAPYGEHLVLSKFAISSPEKGYVIYAGYCNKLKYSWMANDKIEISCKREGPEKVITLSNKAYAINVIYN